MKYKKYILFLLLVLILGVSKTYAREVCYYKTNDLRVTFDTDGSDVYIDQIASKVDHDNEMLLNACSTIFWDNTTEGGYEFETLGGRCLFGLGHSLDFCPAYIVVQAGCGPEGYRVWGTNSASEAQKAVNTINGVQGCVGKMAGYKNPDGSKITAEEYYKGTYDPDLHGGELEEGKECDEIFGDIHDAGTYDENTGEQIEPPSLAYIINTVLSYVRIIVPIALILLGSIDLAKAVMASKEDEIKKYQKDLVIRVVVGVAIFFVPALINLIMKLADIVWEGLGYATCTFPQ